MGNHHKVSLRRPIMRPETPTATADAAAKKRLNVWLKPVIWNPLLAGANRPTMKAMSTGKPMLTKMMMSMLRLESSVSL